MMTPRLLTLLVAASLSGTSYAATKFDATLAAVVEYPALASRLLPIGPSTNVVSRKATELMIPALMRFSGAGLQQAESIGVRVKSVLGDVATVEIPQSLLQDVADIPGVIYLESPRRLKPKLDQSVPATQANTLRSGTPGNLTGATGKGVIVGVVDDGVDFRHEDFRRADGSTRLLALWDMKASGAAGSPPAGFGYGGVCTPAMLNDAINGNAAACTQSSSGGHGTHVASIAAGNGRATGNSQPGDYFVGMAPEADIVAANALGDGVSAGDSVIDGVAFVKSIAQAAGKPAVVNLSLGSYFGSRDGTSNYERALSNAVDAGFFVIGAAGNEADAPIRATGTINQGATVNIGYNIPDANQTYYLEMWYPGTQAFGFQLTGPDGTSCDSGLVAAAAKPVQKETSCGRIVVSSNDTSPNNDDRQIFVSIEPSQSKVAVGKWNVALTATKLGKPSTTFSLMGGEDTQGATFADHVESTTTEIMTDTASSTKVVSVAAYVTKTRWLAVDGKSYIGSSGALGNIANFSSHGPRRDCSNTAKCPPIMKPEITAPGSNIFAALASDDTTTRSSSISPDGKHTGKSGTSMATPHVTGAVALLLQKNPSLSFDALKSALYGGVQSNEFSTNLPIYNAQTLLPQAPNYTWGYGILDAAAAYKAVVVSNTQPAFSGQRTASNGVVTYSASISPASSEIGSTVNIYIGAMLGSNLYLRNGQNWEAYVPPTIPAAESRVATSTMDVNIATLPDALNTQLIGTQLFVGYGKTVAELLNGRVAPVGQVK